MLGIVRLLVVRVTSLVSSVVWGGVVFFAIVILTSFGMNLTKNFVEQKLSLVQTDGGMSGEKWAAGRCQLKRPPSAARVPTV